MSVNNIMSPKPIESGRLVISFDMELAWGTIESSRWQSREASGVYRRTRETTRKLLDALEQCGIKATFGIVGGLLEKPGQWSLDHLPELSRDRTWLALKAGNESSFYGIDMLEMITSSRTQHFIGSHSYSHTRFNHPGVTEEYVREDLHNFWHVFPPGVDVTPILIYPQNDEGYYTIVHECGFKGVRGRDIQPEGHYRWLRQIQATIGNPPLSQISEEVNGLMRSTGSMSFISGARRRLFLVEHQALKGLDLAIQKNGTLHVWNHPFNFAETPGLLDAFIRFIEKAARLRDSGKLEIASIELGK